MTEQPWGEMFTALLPGAPSCTPSLARLLDRQIGGAELRVR